MDLPLIGTVDLTPSGLFLAVAALVAVGYLVWQIISARRALVRARDAEQGAPAEGTTGEGTTAEDATGEDDSDDADATGEDGADASDATGEDGADDADEPGPNAGA